MVSVNRGMLPRMLPRFRSCGDPTTDARSFVRGCKAGRTIMTEILFRFVRIIVIRLQRTDQEATIDVLLQYYKGEMKGFHPCKPSSPVKVL